MKDAVVVVSYCPDSLEMLQRRVGGILKGIAPVEKLLSDELPDEANAAMYVCFARGKNFDVLTERVRGGTPVIGAELTLLPAAVRAVRSIGESKVLGVVSDHQRCANYFLGEIIASAPTPHRYVTGTFHDMPAMPADVFLIPEELEHTARRIGIPAGREAVFLPRAISQRSAAEIIDQAMRLFIKQS